jgi:hypothetical protein
MIESQSPNYSQAGVTSDWIEQSSRVAAGVVRTLTIAIILSAALGQVGIGNAQPPKQPAQESSIAYRLTSGKTMHFDDSKKASEHLTAVKKLGCEVSQEDHEGHGDVVYSCPKWKALTVADDKLAHQWEEWLKGAGFETLHGHAESEHHDHNADGAHDHAEEHEHGHDTGRAGPFCTRRSKMKRKS